jgi:Leucine-rich repeat (LRR) protein
MKTLALLLTILLVPFLLRAQIVHIPDANFKAALVEDGWINNNGDDEIQVSEAEAYTGGIYVDNQGIADMTGLEAFTLLQYLDCSDNQLTSLDVSANTALRHLYCDSNQLASLDVSANAALTTLYCFSNQLTSLDVSGNSALQTLLCNSNLLTSLDVSANTALETLWCGGNQLTSLDVSGNTALQTLLCDSNLLTSLDVSANTALEKLGCGGNQLTSLDVSANTALQELRCNSNQLTRLDVSSNTALTRLDCWSNQLHSLNVRNGNNASIINFNAAPNPALSCITVSDVAYAEANWTNIDEGVIFSEGGCNVYIPDANFKAALLADDAINTIDDSEIQYREAETYSGSIYVPNLSIADITGLEAFKSVTGLDCSANNLSQLVVRQNARIVSIDCGNNELGSLDVSLNPALETLNCASNQLKGLELSNTNNLRQLDCQSNQLEFLDLSVNVNLTELYCQSNQLRSMDVKNGNNAQITAFDARDNPPLSCIAVDDASYSAANWPNVDVQGLFNQEGCAVVYIPDAGFKAALLANTGINTNGDTEIQVSEAKAYTGDIQVPSTGISDMTGLEAFTKLTTLDCSGNQLSELDMKANELLIQLNCSNNQLSRLALRSNPLLEQLDCSNNQLELLDLRMNSALKEMLCQSNQLHSLDLRNGANEAITAFDATVNPTLICITVDDADHAESNWSGIDDGTVFSEDGCNVHISDAIFKAALVGNGEINTNGDGEIQVSEAEAYDGTIDVDDQGIADMTGLEAFVNLTHLECSYNQLTSLDVSANTALAFISCGYNQLTGLDVSANTALTYLYCQSNQLASLDINTNTSLTYLYCSSNQLTALDVSANAKLDYLQCSSNQLTSLDVCANTALTTLSCHGNQLTSLDVSANTALTSLYCHSNQLTNLDVSANTVLNHLSCRSNQLTGLDVSANTVINELFCSSNQLTSLNLRNGNNKRLTDFNATGNPSLTCIAVNDVAFAEANWTNIDEGVIFSEGGCNVYIPDANFKAALLADDAINTNNDSEIQFGEAEAYMGTIDVANLGISDMTGLEAFKSVTGLDCSTNSLSQLNIRLNNRLEFIDCSNNELGSLDVSLNPALETLNCASNQLKGLELSNTNNLRQLDCQSNQLEILDLSVNVNLTELYCQSNQLRSLDVKSGNNEQITAFDARNNPSLSCIAVDDEAYSAANWPNVDVQGLFNEEGCAVVYIPDAGFKAALLANTGINTNGDIEIQVTEAKAYTGDIQVPSTGISDMTGLEAFTNLKALDCSGNQLSQLDVKANQLLTQLNCSNNQLSRLALRSNPLLEQLDCSNNQLELLDLRMNNALKDVLCQSNQLHSLDLRNGANEAITAFDATDNPPLACISVDDADYAKSNWSGIDDGTVFSEDGCNVHIPDAIFKAALVGNGEINTNGDGEIQVSEAEAYDGTIDVDDQGIADMTGLEAFVNLTRLECSYNQLTNLDVSANTLLERLDCVGNQLTSLDVSANAALTTLRCSSNQLTGLDVSANTALTTLRCSNNQLTSLDISANTALTYLDCDNNQLTSLDVRANTLLERLYCGRNQLTSLDVSSNSSLSQLTCSSNQLNSLNLRNGNNKRLTDMYASSNPSLGCIAVSDLAFAEANWTNIDEGVIFSEGGCNVYIPDANFKAALLADDAINTIDDSEIQYREAETYSGSIDVPNLSIADMTGLEAFKSVTGLDCSANNLSQLIVRRNASLVSIDCGNNELGSLDVSLNPALETLNCASNQLKGLSLSTNSNLRQLDCQSNQLEFLDLSDNVKLTELYCQSNQLRSLDVKNGNNEQITAFDVRDNPSLSCIAVDDAAYSAANWPNVDVQGLFNQEGCAVVYIPDAGFKAALLANTGINTNGDTEIQVSEAKAYTGDIQVPSTGISDMTGLQAFTNLTALDCSGNQLSELDVKANELLTQLNCKNNQLSRLALRSNPLLEQLDCSNNQLGLLDLRMNSALKDVLCQSNQLHSLDLRNGANEAITAFDATVNPTLICITVDDADYATANWTMIDAGTVFSEGGCNVYIPDANFKAALVGNSSINTNGDDEIQVGEAEAYDGTIDVDDQGIADMTGLEAFVALTTLYCSSNQLTSLDVGANTNLNSLSCGGNQLTSLDVSANTALIDLSCSGNQLTSLDVSANTVLTYLDCHYNQLTSVDVSTNTALSTLYCRSNQLTSLDVSANTALIDLSCSGNQLTSLDVSANTALTYLYCTENQLTSLDVGANTALTTLWCSFNQLTNLDVSANTALTYLYCTENQLTSLDVGANTALTTLWCSFNQLTNLDVSANTVLRSLKCYSNELTSLDVSANTALTTLRCSNNQLTSLNVRNGNNSSITNFSASQNPALSCITVSDEAFAEANWTRIDQGVIFSEGGCNVYIPDTNFKTALVANGRINTNGDREIQFGEAEAYTGSIEVENLAIADMTGLEAFKSLTGLNCADNELTQLVLRYHTALKSIDCSGNQLDVLDMKANEALKSLNCASNQLTSLDVRNGHNTEITSFDSRKNAMLSCISVDDASYSTENWTNIDAHTSFNGDCGFIADFVADETSGPLPLEVQFTDRSDNTATSWQWDFGDGNTSEEQSPSHTYTAAGTYTVILTISNGNKTNSDSKTGYIDILKGNQTITFEPLEHKALGNPDFELTATASSGLAVSYTSSDLTVATIDGNTVTIIGLGTTTITASQEGNDNYHAADPVAQTLEVMEITALTVEEDDLILVYPNPASSTMILQFESGMRSIRMLNLNGQTVYEKHGIDKLEGRLEIDTSTYPPGEYIIRFEGKGKTTARKVLISR